MKFLIITESAGNPRSFPISEITELEETYPYLIRENFKGSTFWQLSFGNITTEELCSQAMGYLNHWNPDIIIVHSGLNDCRPEAFTEFQKRIILKFSWNVFRILKKFIYHPSIIKWRNVHRVSKRSFKKTLKKFNFLFSKSKIYWLEICADPNYEEIRPGVNKRMVKYNKIVEEIYGEDFVPIRENITNVNGFNVDNLHWNKCAHEAVADILTERIKSHLNDR
jgi:hypothetical protein